MGKEARRAGRAAALRLMYQLDTWEEFAPTAEELGEAFGLADEALDEEGKRLAMVLCRDACGELERIDELLGKASRHWRVARMARVDRCILRLAAGELLAGETPAPVVINEAVELAKAYGTTESGSFVHGVLAAVARELDSR